VFSAVLSEIKGLVDKRFLLNAFFPTLVFVAVVDLLVASANGGIEHQLASWDNYSGVIQVALIGGALAAVLVLAAVLSSCSVVLTQLYEGYHIRPRWLQRRGIKRQEQRRTTARSKKSGNIELRFPSGTLCATSLGNVLRAAEEYPERVYGTRAVAVWPRLFLVTPAEFRQSAAGPADTLQFLLNVSLLATVIGLGGGLYTAIEGLGGALYLSVLIGGVGIARVTYLAAVETAIDYGLHIRGAFDLYRNDLLAKLRRAAPASRDEEQRLWTELSIQFRIGEARPVRYIDPPKG
jgi:hypothetical protein